MFPMSDQPTWAQAVVFNLRKLLSDKSYLNMQLESLTRAD